MTLSDWVAIAQALGAIGTALGVGVAAFAIWNENQQRRCERAFSHCERLTYQGPAAEALVRLSSATANFTEPGNFPPDHEPPRVGSLRQDVSTVLNEIEVICQAVAVGMYDGRLVASYLESILPKLHAAFLRREPCFRTSGVTSLFRQ